jgi:ferredoxin
MAYVVTENCIKCKFQDCVEVCPVECFHEGENMLVIDPEDCIDCGVCVPECPSDAIFSDSDPEASGWSERNISFAQQWPLISKRGEELADADDWIDKPNKIEHLSPKPGRGD